MVILDTIKIGADPEIFVSLGKAQTSCHTLLPGTKKDPFKVPGGAVQVDGTAAEFNIDPASTPDEFRGNISSVLTTMSSMMKEKNPDAQFTWIPTRKYTKRLWNSLPESAKEMGCDPDFNAYTGEENPRPHCDEETLRSAGGHIHIGWGEGINVKSPNHFVDCRLVVMAMDALLYPFSKIWDKDEKRRMLYGKPGAFRVKSYGVEYRTLSNMWVRDSSTQTFVYAAVRTIMKMIMDKDFDPYVSYKVGQMLLDVKSSERTNVSGEFLRSIKDVSLTGGALYHYAEKNGLKFS